MTNSASEPGGEDVLASIRRLILATPAPGGATAASTGASSRAASEPALPAGDRLLLTPALRVAEPAPASPAAPRGLTLEDRIAELEAAVGSQVQEFEPDGSEVAHVRPPEDLIRAVEDLRIETAEADGDLPGLAGDDAPGRTSPTGAETEAKPAAAPEVRRGLFLAVPPQPEPQPEPPAEAPARASDAPMPAGLFFTRHDRAAEEHAEEHTAEDHTAEDQMAEDHAAEEQRAEDQRAEEHRAEQHGAEDHAANDAWGTNEEADTADASAPELQPTADPDAGKAADALDEVPDAPIHAGDVHEAAPFREVETPDAEADLAQFRPTFRHAAHLPGPVVGPTVDTTEIAPEAKVEAEIGARPEGDWRGSEPADAAEVALTIDDAQLRALVAELLHQELQGPLGEKITRNIRKLVRREIERALAVRDFD
ncbi:hypothetical protein ACRDNQ_14280 [Palleronia sp. KMU-117]|uniref:hypothetical protein n=1 Tax=Palleronia sp. KMU-117 TaxID=3434108 RepID=UPI003D75C394